MSIATPLPSDLAGINALLDQIDEQLAQAGYGELASEHTEAMEQLRRRFEDRFEALGKAHAAAAALRQFTSPHELLLQAPAALCNGSGFHRVILSAVRGSELHPLAARFTDDPDSGRRAVDQLRAEPIHLEHQLLETDVLRRKRAMLVHNSLVNPRVDPRVPQALGGADAYVAAPLLAGTRVVGIVHASCPAAHQLDALDRDVLWEFTSLLSRVHESAELRRTLRSERTELSRFLEWLNARSVSLAQAPVTFSVYADQGEQPPQQQAPSEQWTPAASDRRDDRLIFEGLLTRRELEVLRLLAEGGTNRAIADALVVSDATIKFHTRSILRKLRVANRAEAVARYLAMVGAPPLS
jgi:DNA-binding CsgD family transcriptional regulator